MRSRRDLRLLVLAVGISAAGDFLALIALSVRVHDTGGSGLAVAALFGALMVPVVVLAPLAGLLADRVETVRLLALTAAGQAAVALALAWVDGLGAIIALTALLGVGAALGQPAEFALVPAIVGDEDRTRANGRLETARYMGFTAGPLAAGVVTAAGGTRLALIVNAASFLVVAVGAAAMKARRAPDGASAGDDGGALEGIELLWRDRVLRVVILAATGALVVVSASITAEVFYAKDVLGAGDAGYGALIASWTLGMVAGATGLAARVGRRSPASVALVALGVQGAGMVAGASWAIVPVALAGFLIGGAGHGVKNVLIRSVIQERVPERVHGRAFAGYNAARNTAELAALGAGGVLVAAFGAQAALIVAGSGPMLAAVLGLAVLGGRIAVPQPEVVS
jgi:Na+/melibiose symporter-like transporter